MRSFKQAAKVEIFVTNEILKWSNDFNVKTRLKVGSWDVYIFWTLINGKHKLRRVCATQKVSQLKNKSSIS